MDYRTGCQRGPRRSWPWKRVAAVMSVMTAAALLATACGGSPSSTRSSGSQAAAGATSSLSAVNYSQCMRAHGVPNFPDPDSKGQIPKLTSGQVEVSDSQLDTARKACQDLWPYQPLSGAQLQRQMAENLKFAQCMRSHGLPKFPDPTNSDGVVVFVVSISRDGFDPHSQPILAKAQECQQVLPAGSRLPSVRVSP
jgi:hypothetical protein